MSLEVWGMPHAQRRDKISYSLGTVVVTGKHSYNNVWSSYNHRIQIIFKSNCFEQKFPLNNCIGSYLQICFFMYRHILLIISSHCELPSVDLPTEASRPKSKASGVEEVSKKHTECLRWTEIIRVGVHGGISKYWTNSKKKTVEKTCFVF